MNAKIRNHEIVKNETKKIGRYIITQVINQKGLRGIGISRCSDLDTFNQELGEKIARGRAEKALTYKEKSIRINNAFMG